MDVYPMLCENYNGMSQAFYAQYQEATAYLKSLKCKSWDFLSHTTEENDSYNEANSMRLHSAVAAVTFQALAIEAFVNLYGAQKVGDNVFYEKYDHKGATTLGKLKGICKDVLSKNYPTNGKAYSRLVSLMDKRNDIVHTKPHPIPIIPTSEVPNYSELMYQTEFVFKNIDDEMLSYGTLKETLMVLEGKETDFIQENYNEAMDACSKAVAEMFTNALFSNGGDHE